MISQSTKKDNFFYNTKELWEINTQNDFEYCSVKNQNQVLAKIPVHIRKKAGFRFLLMPVYTPYIDIELFENIQFESNYAQIKYENNLYTKLIENLPKVDYINIRFKPGIVNLLPFYWKGFSLKVRYSYFLETRNAAGEIFDDFHPTLKKDIAKATENLEIKQEINPTILFQCMKSSFEAKNNVIHSTFLHVEQLVKFVASQNKAYQFNALDKNGEVAASILFVFDNEFVHYYMGGVISAARNSGAMGLLLLEGIKLAKSKGLTFNFEGSMIPDIEKYFRKFNGVLTPYYEVEKFNNKLLKAGNVFSKKL